MSTKQIQKNQITIERAEANNVSALSNIRLKLTRYGLPIFLPIISAATTAVAAVNHGPVRVYWSIGAFVSIGLSATANVLKERASVASRETAERTKTELATALADIGLPLIVALGEVAATQSLGDAVAKIDVLIDRAVNLAQTELGKQSGSQCRVRASYYAFDGDKLVRKKYHTWAGAKAPRTDFVKGRSDHDNEVVSFARGEDVRFVRDLNREAPPYFADPGGRCYRSFISVPVKAANDHFGLLTADADTAYSLTNADRGFLILVAGTLAAGLAHVEKIDAITKIASNP